MPRLSLSRVLRWSCQPLVPHLFRDVLLLIFREWGCSYLTLLVSIYAICRCVRGLYVHDARAGSSGVSRTLGYFFGVVFSSAFSQRRAFILGAGLGDRGYDVGEYHCLHYTKEFHSVTGSSSSVSGYVSSYRKGLLVNSAVRVNGAYANTANDASYAAMHQGASGVVFLVSHGRVTSGGEATGLLVECFPFVYGRGGQGQRHRTLVAAS